MGDVKLAGAMGLYLGVSVDPGAAGRVPDGPIVGLAIIAREGAAARKKAVPFGVFLALGGHRRSAGWARSSIDVYRTTFLE